MPSQRAPLRVAFDVGEKSGKDSLENALFERQGLGVGDLLVARGLKLGDGIGVAGLGRSNQGIELVLRQVLRAAGKK